MFLSLMFGSTSTIAACLSIGLVAGPSCLRSTSVCPWCGQRRCQDALSTLAVLGEVVSSTGCLQDSGCQSNNPPESLPSKFKYDILCTRYRVPPPAPQPPAVFSTPPPPPTSYPDSYGYRRSPLILNEGWKKYHEKINYNRGRLANQYLNFNCDWWQRIEDKLWY